MKEFTAMESMLLLRLEALCDPGGICISKTAFDHIESKLPLGYEYIGEQTVKNIPKAVGAYRVLMEPRVPAPEGIEKKKSVPLWRKKPVLVSVIALRVVIMALAIWNFYFPGPSWIRDLAAEISIRAGKKAISPLVWRVAAKQWVMKNGLIKIQRAGKMLPNFSPNLCHN